MGGTLAGRWATIGHPGSLRNLRLVYPLCACCSWSKGQCVFASGSPFAPVEVGAERYMPGQANNVFVVSCNALPAGLTGSRSVGWP